MKLTRRVLYLAAKDCNFKLPEANLKLAQEMFNLMKKSKGIGLSANQCGIRKKIFVMHIDGKDYACFNPIILEASQETDILNEGCLSFPGEECRLERPKEIIVEYADAWGNKIKEKLVGITARCFQHEFDHLNGLTMQQRSQYAKQS